MRSVKESWESAKEILGVETGSIVLLSSVSSLFYSSLLKMGFAQDRPIGFLCGDWKDVRLAHNHIRYEADNSMMPLSGKKDALLSNIWTRRDDISLFQYRPCTASDENLRWLTEAMDNAAMCQSALPSVIAVAFKDIMPLDAPEEWLLCELPNCDRLFSMPHTLLPELEEYAEKHEERILCPLQDFRKTLQAQYDVSWLYAVAYMLAKICSDFEEGLALYKELTAALELALKKSDSLREAGNLSALFADSFNRYIGAHPESLTPRGMIRKNPFKFQVSDILQNDAEKRTALTKTQQEAYLKYVQEYGEDNYYDDIVVLLGTGLRVSELYGLTKSDVDFKTRCIYVDHQLCRTAEKPYFITSPKTSSGVRTIPMSDTVYLALKRVMKNRQTGKAERIVDGYGGFLFLDKSGMPKVAMHLENYMRGIQKKVNRLYGASFPRVTPHVLRHTFCTNMQQAGIDVKSLQYLMGHSNVSVTLDVYTHTDFNAVQEAFTKAAASL